MSNDGVSQEDQAAANAIARGVMQQLAAGRSPEEVARELHLNGCQKSTADALVEHVLQDWRQIEAAPMANAALYLQMKYPEMKPVGSVPTLQTVHGIGTMFYGSRDHDRATGTQVKTQCFCVFFFPLFFLRAYRVATRGSGWNLIGRVPLSRFAKIWNVLALAAILAAVVGGIVGSYLDSPSVVASRNLGRADRAAEAGKLLEAARLYRRVADSRTEFAETARQRCVQLLDRPEIDGMPAGHLALLFDHVFQPSMGSWSAAALARGLAIVKSHAQADPAGSMMLLSRVARVHSAEAVETFAELIDGPLAALPPAQTLAVFLDAANMSLDNGQKTRLVALGVKQSRRLAATDLTAALDLLAILVPLGDRPAIGQCLAELLGSPLGKASAADVAKAVRSVNRFAEPEDERKLAAAVIAWVEHHPQAATGEVFGLLDQLAELPGADRARVAATRRPLLEKLVAAHPHDMDPAVQLALAIEAEGAPLRGKTAGDGSPSAQIIKLLAPFREKLGAGEGARMLGQALAEEGKFGESYALLNPYVDSQLNALHEAEQAHQTALRQVYSRVQRQLEDGTAPEFDFERASRATKNEADMMVMEYTARQIQADGAVAAARESLKKLGMVVPAALDLGMVTLERAQATTDPAARKKELERAEKTFLAIRGTAGESDQYLLHMGQVYYWLGKQNDGRQEFDKLLAKHDRSAETLSGLASVLRELGAAAEARKLMEEAYNKAPNNRVKQSIAHLRAITSTGLEDELQWLDRSDPADLQVKAQRAETQGAQAESLGKDDAAAAFYRQAAAFYEQQPPDVSVLNNGAMAYISLFEISGDRHALERGIEWLEKALRLSPMDAVILGNTANQILRRAIQDLAGSKISLRELQNSANIDALYYLASDQKSLDGLRRRAREHAGLRKGLAYADRVSVLAPKNVDNKATALAVYSFLRDREALQRFSRQVVAAMPDTREHAEKAIKFLQYKDDDFSAEKIGAKVARADALVARLAARDKGPGYAAAVGNLVDLKLMLPERQGDADELVRLAEDAHRAAPSMPTFSTLIEALMHRAGEKLAADYPQYAQACRGTQRAVPASYAIALALARGDALGKAARENPDVQRAAALTAARVEAFPETRGPWVWAVLAAAPSQASLRAKCLAPDDLEEIERQINAALEPINPRDALDTYWRRLTAGDAHAREPLDRLVQLGVPLPVSLIDLNAPAGLAPAERRIGN